jgi:hypothetical protein
MDFSIFLNLLLSLYSGYMYLGLCSSQHSAFTAILALNGFQRFVITVKFTNTRIDVIQDIGTNVTGFIRLQT